jgi:hypothetical protein
MVRSGGFRATTRGRAAPAFSYEAAVPGGGRATAASDRAFATGGRVAAAGNWKKVEKHSRQSRNRISEYLSQRRKGRKGRKEWYKSLAKIF